MPDLTELQATLTALKSARDRILTSGQEHSTEFSRNRRGDLKTILDEINSVEMQIARASGKTVTYPIFGDRR